MISMICLNGCGDLVEIKKPAWVLIDMEFLDYLPAEVKTRITICTLILKICPNCGFTVSRHLNINEWQEFIKERK